jgi:hypothetical protein
MKTDTNEKSAVSAETVHKKTETPDTLPQPNLDRKPPPDYRMVIYWTEVRWTGDLRSETDMELTLRRESGLPTSSMSIAAYRKSRLIENGRIEAYRSTLKTCGNSPESARMQLIMLGRGERPCP